MIVCCVSFCQAIMSLGARVRQTYGTNGFLASWTYGRHVFFGNGMRSTGKIRGGQSVTGPDVGKASKFEPTWILIFVPTSKPQQCAGVNESYISSWLGYFVWIRLSVLINYWTFRCISQWLHVFVFKSNTPYPCCLRRFSKKRSADMKAM